MLEQKKRKSKKRFIIEIIIIATVSLASSYIPPMIESYQLKQPETIYATETNIYHMDFLHDFQAIMDVKKLEWGKLIQFDVNYEPDGKIIDYRFELLSRGKYGKLAQIDVFLSPLTKNYHIETTLLEDYSDWGGYLDAKHFFTQLNEANLEKMKPEGSYSSFNLHSVGVSIPILENDDPKFKLVGSKFVPLVERHEILASYYIQSYGTDLDGILKEEDSHWYRLNGYVGR